MAINTASWKTLGFATLNDVRVGFPKVAAFDLTSDKLPPPANLAGNHHFCVLALLHHPGDPYTSTNVNTDQNSVQERKAAHKNLTVVQFTGTLPAPPPAMIAFRIHAARAGQKNICDLSFDLRGYPGRIRLFLPKIAADGDLVELAEGLSAKKDFVAFRKWEAAQKKLIEGSQAGKQGGYNKSWCKQRLADIAKARDHGVMFVATGRKRVELRRLILAPETHHTLFLMLDRPPDGAIGSSFDLSIAQRDSESRGIRGGLDVRIDLVPSPETKVAIAGRRKPARAREREIKRPTVRA